MQIEFDLSNIITKVSFTVKLGRKKIKGHAIIYDNEEQDIRQVVVKFRKVKNIDQEKLQQIENFVKSSIKENF